MCGYSLGSSGSGRQTTVGWLMMTVFGYLVATSLKTYTDKTQRYYMAISNPVPACFNRKAMLPQ